MIEQLFNAIFLISGTAVGSGLVALPLTAVNLGLGLTVALLMGAIFVAYTTSMMAIDLNKARGSSGSIVALSRFFAGRKAFYCTMASFYALSFALLTVYFSCIASALAAFFHVKESLLVVGSGGLLFCILTLKAKLFSRINTILVCTLLTIIVSFIVQFVANGYVVSYSSAATPHELAVFLPIVFTSFGVQNICPYIYEGLGGDRPKIQRAFFIGLCIPAMIYMVWIASVCGNIRARDSLFFEALQQHQVSVGELIQCLCRSSGSVVMEVLFKVLSLFAIITSAIGIGLGLKKSLEETLPTRRKSLAGVAVCSVPVVVCVTFPNAFLHILSFGAMIASVFVIFMPYTLKRKLNQPLSLRHHICLGVGGLIVLCEVLQYFG